MGNSLTDIIGIGPQTAKFLSGNGFKTVESVANASTDALSQVQGFSVTRAEKIIQAAAALFTESKVHPVEATGRKKTKSGTKSDKEKKDMAKKKRKGKLKKKDKLKKKNKRKGKKGKK